MVNKLVADETFNISEINIAENRTIIFLLGQSNPTAHNSIMAIECHNWSIILRGIYEYTYIRSMQHIGKVFVNDNPSQA